MSSDIKRIILSSEWVDILENVTGFVSEHLHANGYHEDYERDACEEMISLGGPFSSYIPEVYEDQTGESYSEGDSITFDDLRGFSFSQSDDFIFNFLINYLTAIHPDHSNPSGSVVIPEGDWRDHLLVKLEDTITALEGEK